MLPLFLALIAGCDSDCEDASRLNGEYAMWHSVLNASEEGGATMDEGYPSYEVFVNGWSRWDLTWSASGGTFSAAISDVAELQGSGGETTPVTYNGTLTSRDDNCNAFDLGLTGQFEAASGTTHDFAYTAELVYYGDDVAGHFTYEDTWSGADGASGSLKGAAGDVYGVLQTDGAFDTGFTEE